MLKNRLVLVLLVLVVGVSAAAAQDTIDPELTEQMVNLEAVTVALRDLPMLQAVERQFPTRQETIAYLRDLYAREFPPEEFIRLQRFYVALDLLDADVELQEVFLNLLGSQVAGFYDSDTQIMNVLPVVGDDPGTSLSVTEQVIYVHEFTHALQDQHFDLNALLDTPDAIDQPDRTLALTALVEGDATAVMTLYSQEILGFGPFGHGMLLTAGAAGGVLAGLAGPGIVARFGSGRTVHGAMIIFALSYLLMGLFPSRPMAVVGLFGDAFGGVLWNVVTVSYRQRVIPREILGRVNAIYRFLGWGMMPIGAIAGGLIVRRAEPLIGREDALMLPFTLAGLVTIALTVYGFFRIRFPA